jgi:hypothetical protein
MKTSEHIDKIAPALLNAQKAIANAKKGSINPHFKNRYADLGSVIEAVKEHLNENSIVFIQSLTVADTAAELALVTRLLHASGQWIEDTACTPLSKNDPQGVGSATTYLRRYSLAAICGITQEDDDGESARKTPITKEQADKLGTLDKGRVEKALAFYKVTDVKDLDSQQAQTIISKLT